MLDVKGSNFVYEYDNEVKTRVLKGISALLVTQLYKKHIKDSKAKT